MPQEARAPSLNNSTLTFSETHSIQAMFQALAVTRPEHVFDNVDVVLSRGLLAHIVRFCGMGSKGFRVDASLVRDSTLVFQYRPVAGMLEPWPQSASLGLQCEKSVAGYPAGLEDSYNHYRVLRYKLGPLECVVSFEADATTEPYSCTTSSGEGAETMARVERSAADAVVVRRGHLTKQEHAVEIRSFSGTKWRPALEGGLTRLRFWFGCTGHVLVGRRYDARGGGSFESVKLKDVRQKIREFASHPRKYEALGRLPPLISALKEAVRAAPNARAAFVFRGGGGANADVGGEIDVYSIEQEQEGPAIPQTAIEKFWTASRSKL
ncbi:hypothetical protein PG984_007793 [Apiospora sp. TS-2023a]